MRKFTWIAVGAASLGLVACGGGDDEGNSQLSYADYGKEADQICKDADAKLTPISQKLTGEAANDASNIGQLVGEFEKAVGEFKKLNPPEELKADHDEFVRLSDEQLAATKAAEQAAKSGDTEGYQAKLNEVEPLDKQSDEVASRLGAAECANS